MVSGATQYHASVRRTFLFGCLMAVSATIGLAAPSVTLPLWPNGTPDAWHPNGPERDTTTAKDDLVAGKRVARITAIAKPTLTYYPPKVANTGAAALVFPGGGYQILAYDLEGSEVCDWITSIGMSCVLVKYRVPAPSRYPEGTMDLADAQAAMRITASHAKDWQIDVKRIGVIGFSAGGHLAVVLSNHWNQKLANVPEAGGFVRPAFAMVIYPGYLRNEASPKTLSPGVAPSADTPPTFLLQAEDDPVHEENALLYFQALKEAGVPAEIHLFAAGRHGYGLRRTNLPVTRWPDYAQTWLHTIGILQPSAGKTK